MSSSAASEGADPPPHASVPPVTIPVICGPTASGKSAIAMWLAERRCESAGRGILVISADSRQIYRGFDIGTAKPTVEERARVPHRGVDVAEPGERYSAARWAGLAETAIREAISLGRLPVVVGGTGFYIAALFRPLWAQPELDPVQRAELQRVLASQSTDELRRWCRALDPARAHLGRPQLMRAIEVALLTGNRLSELHTARARSARHEASYLLVDPGTSLPARIATRAVAMLDAGWPEEVRRLMETAPADAPAWHATGYDIVRQFVCGSMDRATALERVVVETRQYAKRQRTWFRHQLERDRVRRLDPDIPGWQNVVDRWISELGATMSDSSERAR